MFKLRIWVKFRAVFLALPLMAFAVCSGGCHFERPQDDLTVFRYNASDGLQSLDPAQARDLEAMWVVDQLYEGLLELTPELEVVGALAERWSVDSARTRWTFHLREGAEFHSGVAVTASDVVASWDRILSEEVASPGRWIFDGVRTGEGLGFWAADDSTVVVDLDRPQPNFEGLLCTVYTSVIEGGGEGLDLATMEGGSGPFKLAWWEPGIALVLHRHKGYWMRDAAGEALPYMEAVHVGFNREPAVEFLGLLQGRYDFVSGIDPAFSAELLDDAGELLESRAAELTYYRTPYLKTDYIGVLVDEHAVGQLDVPTTTPEIRQAMSWAVDRAAMSKYIRRGTTEPAVGFVPPGMPGFAQGTRSPLPFDPVRARQYMATLGYTPEEPLQGLWVSTKPETADLCAYLQSAWREIGIDVRVDVAPSGVDAERVARGEAPLFRKSWLADYPDAENYLALFTSERAAPAGPNYARFSSKEVDLLYERMQAERSPEVRLALQRELEIKVLKELPVIPLWHDRVSHFVRNNVEGWRITPSNRLDLRYVRKGVTHRPSFRP
jgi:oligopeptide transport system substrate-binding protein